MLNVQYKEKTIYFYNFVTIFLDASDLVCVKVTILFFYIYKAYAIMSVFGVAW